MAPSVAQLSHQLRQTIYYHLDNDLTSNALFLAGRLHALEPRNPDAVHLLALCHYRQGQAKAAYDYTRILGLGKGSHLGCSYVFAQACLVLDRTTDGIAALEKARALWEGEVYWNQHSETARKHIPDAAAVYCLLGKLFHRNQDIKHAVDCYVEALRLNPFMWDAFQRLCDTGTDIKPINIFRANPEMISLMSTSSAMAAHSTDLEHLNLSTPGYDPFNMSETVGSHGRNFSGVPLASKLNMGKMSSNLGDTASNILGMETPPMHSTEQDTFILGDSMTAAAATGPQAPNAPLRKPRVVPVSSMDAIQNSRSRAKTTSDSNDYQEIAKGALYQGQHKRTASGNMPHGTLGTTADSILAASVATQRRSVRLLNHMRPNGGKTLSVPSGLATTSREVKKATSTKGRSLATSTVGRVVSGNRKLVQGAEILLKNGRSQTGIGESASSNQESGTQENHGFEALHWLLELFLKLGDGYYALSRYYCQTAIQHFQSIPTPQRETPWVLAQIGRAHYEQSNYLDAGKAFARVRKMVPSRIQDMEIYSTVLWHLKNDTELAFLSHELIEAERLSPQAWCTIGNSFALQRDHNQALKCFKRATQLDHNFAYGFTLQGHEHVANEEYDKALLAYRKAIHADHRHYNGWYGLGRVYDKQGKYDTARKHYKRAAEINPTNAILVCCMGVVLEKLKKPQAALDQYNIACELAPNSSVTRFKKARMLIQMQRPREALEEFKILKDLVPDEPNVHFMLGRVYKSLHDKKSAVKHFTSAMTLDPKAAQHIKEHMENLDDDDGDDMEDDDDDEMS